MRNPFRRKRRDDESASNRDDSANQTHNQDIVPIEDMEIELLDDDEVNELALYEECEDTTSHDDGLHFADAFIPLAAAITDAAGQFGQAVVRFPEGRSFKDLMPRRSEGWEGWSQLGIFDEGKFQPQAAIRQAKLQPAAVANLALQGAALVVGQAYMTQINQSLDGIEKHLMSIQEDLSLEREAKVEAMFHTLREYLGRFNEISMNPGIRQAVLDNIENIKLDALATWKYQVKSFNTFTKHLHKPGNMKLDDVKRSVSEFEKHERDACIAFQLLYAASFVAVQYEGDFGTSRLVHEAELLDGYMDEYSEARVRAVELLLKKIGSCKGPILAMPETADEEYENQGPVPDALHAVVVNVPRAWPPAMLDEANRRKRHEQRTLRKRVSGHDIIDQIGEERINDLKRMDYEFNEADAILIDGSSVKFVSTKPKRFDTPLNPSDLAADE